MIVMGHQPNYLPYCGFFHKIAHCDLFILLDTVQFIKKGPLGWQHRNRIRTKDGWIWLTVPILTKGRYTQKIKDVEINNMTPWRHKHWRSIYLNYNKAPYFYKYSDFFEDLYKRSWNKLLDLNREIIRYLLGALKIKKRVVLGSELNLEGQKTHLLVDMCKKLDADTYLSGIHGRDYIDYDVLKKNNLKVVFQNFVHPLYNQGYKDFIPNLSVIDLLFHEGGRSLELIINKGEKPYVE